ncbi:hypothetical protein TraAM80_08406 [Trypanosoma rangeli]|uniref:Uncharacterized protein n=1 Tax=Trypanosoma rangeli TaxID=5698 RepID=A0A3R7M469_TRYRA|nr:uncharacterized protein TraAM80_08406 [Trypanosoma rangeli]RNE99082.1 hypothetical protein TraAM80_08406 [Trypanosoma rangeli]|eukprot:RNE99082.1 hypothetical protein TraAM80_08406 [Trypanosoma rangeli]
MLQRSFLRGMWLGGTASIAALGHDTRPSTGKYINVLPPTDIAKSIAAGAMPPEANVAAVRPVPGMYYGRWNRALRSEVYDELLKLPLRYKLHDFSKICPQPSSSSSLSSPQQPYRKVGVIGRESAVGYNPPLGPADPLDTIPFFVHRNSNGFLPGKVYSMNARNLMPAFFLRIQQVEGDVFRFEEELLKIFPTKKIFVRSHSIYVYNVGMDGRMILHHWLLGLGF